MTGLAVPDYDAAISFGLPFEPEDCQYGKSRLNIVRVIALVLLALLIGSILLWWFVLR